MGIALFFRPPAIGSGEATILSRSTLPQLSFLAFLLPWSAWMLWLSTRVATAFDFSDNLGGLFGRRRRVYAILDPVFFEAFRWANVHRALGT